MAFYSNKEKVNLLKLKIMEIANIRKKLHQLIDIIEDKKAEAIYTLFENEIDTESQRKNLIQKEREKYINGEGKSYSWDEVKQMAIDKEKRHNLIIL